MNNYSWLWGYINEQNEQNPSHYEACILPGVGEVQVIVPWREEAKTVTEINLPSLSINKKTSLFFIHKQHS